MAYDGRLRDLTALGGQPDQFVEDSVVQIVDRSGQVTFEWNSWDQVKYEEQTTPDVRAEYAHVNSVFVEPGGDLIISARGTSQVVKVSRSNAQTTWKLGGLSNQFQFINDPFGNLCGQHTASRLDNGNILLFDNGVQCWPIVPERGELTRVSEYRLDEQTFEAELVWSYSQEGAFTRAQGSAQRLQNGNTLIGWGLGPNLLATEVNAAGEKVFEIAAVGDNGVFTTYRAQRFPE